MPELSTLGGPIKLAALIYDTLADLLAETDPMAEGEIASTLLEGHRYEVAPSSVTNHDEVTAGGAKLYRIFHASTDIGVIARPGPPVAVPSGTPGNVNGAVYYAVTFVTADGETDAGSRVGPIVCSNETVNITGIPVSSDHRVVARNIYRTPNGAGDPVLGQFLTTIGDNTTTAYSDNTLDANLGPAAPWTNTTGGYFTNGSGKIAGFSGQAVSIGEAAMPNVAGGYACTAMGANALADLTTGIRNTAVGHSALGNVTTGNTNVGVGVHAGEGTTTGLGNVSVGYGAGQANSLGSNNINIGANSGQEVTAGDRNAFIGSSAGQLRATGNDNTGIGYQALRGSAASTGNGNTGIGRGAGANLTTGNFNVAIGYLANAGSTAHSNTVIGTNAGLSLSSGGGNVFIGSNAGKWVTTQSNRLFIDNTARADATDAEQKALVFGVFSTSRTNQQLHVNGRAFLNAGMQLPTTAVSGDYSPEFSDHTINVTGTGTVTLTLTNPLNLPGKIYHIRTKAAQAVVAASPHVIPIAGGSASTAILPPTAGSWATIQAIGSFWEIIAAG